MCFVSSREEEAYSSPPDLHARTSTPHRSRRSSSFLSPRVVVASELNLLSVASPPSFPFSFRHLPRAISPPSSSSSSRLSLHEGPTSQPSTWGRAMGWAARFLTAASFLAAGFLFAPDALRLGRSGDGAPAAARLAHLLAFATAWGRRALGLLRRRQRHVQMMKKKYKVEKDLGIGTEVGYSRNVEMAKKSPALAAMNRKFRMIHVLSTLASLMAFGSLAMHSWYLSSKLDL